MRGRTGYAKIFFCVTVFLSASLLTSGSLSSQSPTQGGDEDFRFRPDHERQALAGDSAYQKFIKQEGVPVHTGLSANLYTVKLGPWKRLGPGVTGAYLNLEGGGGVVDAIVWEVAVGAQSQPERHLFEEQVLVLRGEGETHIWQNDPAKKVVVPWRRGTVFSPPLNAWHQHINKGREPARLAATTDLPLKIDIFRNPDFIFNDSYNFTDRYNGQINYFDPENSIDYSPKTSNALSIVNLIRDAWTWRLFHSGQGYGDIHRSFLMSENTMSGFIEAFPVGAYERAHHHGPGATIVHLGGSGYSLMWPKGLGQTPWKDGKGDKVAKVDWQEGIILIPPNEWYHQHFATGPQHAKFVKLGSPPGNTKYPITTKLIFGDTRMVLFKDEDPHVRQLFEKELARKGAKMIMPPMKELIDLEKVGQMWQNTGGRMPPIPGSTVR